MSSSRAASLLRGRLNQALSVLQPSLQHDQNAALALTTAAGTVSVIFFLKLYSTSYNNASIVATATSTVADKNNGSNRLKSNICKHFWLCLSPFSLSNSPCFCDDDGKSSKDHGTTVDCTNEDEFVNDNNDNRSEHDDNSFSRDDESERFHQCLEFHRYFLPDYLRRWQGSGSDDSPADDGTGWPKNIPLASEIPALEMDLKFCDRSSTLPSKNCSDLRFRIAAYYLSQTESQSGRQNGYRIIKELAEAGHPDSMCLYGKVLNEGGIDGVDVKPNQATIWWRRCIDFHKHIEAAYELAVAMYTGEGVAENVRIAADLFYRAANLGHAGSAYMLGECLLNGVGVHRDRAEALEWLVTSAELGHKLARKRVVSVLQNDYFTLDSGEANVSQESETLKWVNEEHKEKAMTVNIERRYTIGGGSRNPAILANRRTKVTESRGQTDQDDESANQSEETDA